jgi:hypothetical protein
MKRVLIAIAAFSILAAPAAARERAKIHVTCEEADNKLHFKCMAHVMGTKSKKPIDGAELSIKPDMPAMPGAHNIPSVKAKPAGKPGMYAWKMRLDMYGVWALKIIIKGPVRDITVKKIDFKGAGGSKKMNHSKHKHH